MIEILFVLLIWSSIGFFFCIPFVITYDFDYVNPVSIYRYYHRGLNWFGTIIVAIIYNAFCPIYSLLYWFSKLCTVGRR